MKKLSLLAASVAGFMLIAAPIYMKMESHGLTMNGKQFANAQLVNGVWAMSLEDFAKLAGNGVTLEPTFKLQGNQLIGLLLPAVQKAQKADLKIAPASALDAAYKEQHKVEGVGAFHVQKAGVISKNVFMYNGKAFVPLADVARAFGGTFTAPQGNLSPGQSLSLNFTVNGDGILAFNH